MTKYLFDRTHTGKNHINFLLHFVSIFFFPIIYVPSILLLYTSMLFFFREYCVCLSYKQSYIQLHLTLHPLQ